MALNDNFEGIKTKREEIKSLSSIDAVKYNEYIDICNTFQLNLKELEESINGWDEKTELDSFYNECMKKEELDNFIENYRKEVGEKYSTYVIEHLNDEDEKTKTNTNQIVRLTPELTKELLEKIKWENELDLDKLEDIEPDTASVLSWFPWKIISLNWLKNYSEWVANLKNFKWENLYLKWISTLSKDDIENIKEFEVKSINFGEIKDSNIIDLLSWIEKKYINIEKWEEKKEWKEWDWDKKEWDEWKEIKKGKKILDWIEKQRNNLKNWFKDRSWVKSIKADLDAEGMTFRDWVRKKLIK